MCAKRDLELLSAEHFSVNGTMIEASASMKSFRLQEPEEQNVVIECLAKQPITAHRIQCNQQLTLRQALRWNGRTTNLTVNPIQYRAHLLERRIGVCFD